MMPPITADPDLLKMVTVKILLNFGNYFRTLQLGFLKFLSGIVFLHYLVRTIGLFFLQAHSIWPKPRAFNPDQNRWEPLNSAVRSPHNIILFELNFNVKFPLIHLLYFLIDLIYTIIYILKSRNQSIHWKKMIINICII